MTLTRVAPSHALSEALVIRSLRSVLTLALGAGTLATALAAGAAPAQSAPLDDLVGGPDGITPGVQMYTAGAQCTGNFVFTDGDATYVGYAAHCAGSGEATDTNGCEVDSLPLGTPVSFRTGGSLLGEGTEIGTGRLAYSSWLAMDARGETDADTCAFNDFALVEVDAGSEADVDPTVPFWGGPTAVGGATAPGDVLHSYGNSSLRAGVSVLSPKAGASLGTSGGGWSHSAYTVTPGVPGDSGSGFMDSEGRAIGTLSTLALAPLPASNGLGDLARELAYARADVPGLRLVPGDEPFSPVL